MSIGESTLIRNATRMADMVGEKAHVIQRSIALSPAMLSIDTVTVDKIVRTSQLVGRDNLYESVAVSLAGVRADELKWKA